MTSFYRIYDGDPNELAIILAFDPGETTGWCAMGVDPSALLGADTPTDTIQSRLLLCEYGTIDCSATASSGDIPDSIRRHAGLNLAGENIGVERMLGLVKDWPMAAVVVEDFILDMNRADQARHTLSPVRITSALSYGLHSMGHNPSKIIVQNRSLAKTTCTDDRLKNWGLYDSHSGPHARDATRHAFYVLRTCRGAGAEPAERRHIVFPHLFDDPVSRNFVPKPKRQKPLGDRISNLG
jgi:hypothetical protein